MICGVTDHAVLRTCQRVLGIDTREAKRVIRRRGDDVTTAALLAEISDEVDVEAVRAALTSVAELLAMTGACALRRGGWRYVGHRGVLVTVLRANR